MFTPHTLYIIVFCYLLILFAVIIALTALKLINFLGLLTGMLTVFLVLIKEAVHQAQKQ